MIAPSEPLAAAVSETPSLAAAAIRMFFMISLVVVAAWIYLRWRRTHRAPSRLLEVVDRAVLSRNASVAVVQVGCRRVLVGISNEGVRLLQDLGEGTAAEDTGGSAA